MLRVIVLSLFYLFSFIAFSGQANQIDQATPQGKPLRIAVAANFSPLLKVLLQDFTQNTGIRYQIISSGSGALFLQIQHGAPFDIFLSADSKRPRALETLKFGVEGTRKTYALGQLALYENNNTPLFTQLSDLQKVPNRFAIANPDIAPYGKAAKETLENLQLWQAYQGYLVKGINIGQTFTQVHSKAVNSGFVANSQLVLNNLSGIIIPNDFHEPIQQQLIIIKASSQQQNAKMLSDFLLSADIQRKISENGYAVRSNSEEIG